MNDIEKINEIIKTWHECETIQTPYHQARLKKILLESRSYKKINPFLFFRLQPIVLMVIIVLAGLIGLGTVKAIDYFTTGSFSLSYERWTKGETYDMVIKTADSPDWQRVSFTKQLSLEVPYSAVWRVDNKALLPFDKEMSDGFDGGTLFRFGKYVGEGNSFYREYSLTIGENRSLDEIKQQAVGSCFDTQPRVTHVGGHAVVQYLIGGAAGCSLEVSFPLKNQTITITQMHPFGTPEPTELSDDLRKIISSIQN